MRKRRVPGHEGALLTRPSVVVKKPSPLDERRPLQPGPPKRLCPLIWAESGWQRVALPWTSHPPPQM